MAQTGTKKRRLKGSVRRTLGALFMISALLVAAIPVDNLRADSTDGRVKVTVQADRCGIPLVASNETIYTTGDGMFQFAYVAPNDTTNKVAVILGYEGGTLANNTLVIPDTVTAFRKYSVASGELDTCAVAKNGAFLYFEDKIPVKDLDGNDVYENTDKFLLDKDGNVQKDDDGNIIYVQRQVFRYEYRPCYYSEIAKWENLKPEEFYYKASDGTYRETSALDQQLLTDIKVKYIGNQYLNIVGNDWKVGGIIDEPEKGIFRGEKAGNIVTLKVGEELSGVGSYAFYGCRSLSSIQLGNGLDTIGNYAFANCSNMNSVQLELNSMLTTIGDHAFYNCDGLKSFTVPLGVMALGDSAFEDCNSLQTVDLCGRGNNVALDKLGYNVFRGCSSLTGLEFPQSFGERDVEIGMFAGCSSLKYIKANNTDMTIIQDSRGNFTFDDFKATVPTEFYFEGVGGTDLHNMASENGIAFKYKNEDLYEIQVDDGTGRRAIYRVDSSNELKTCEVPEGIEKVEIPANVGPYKISNISSSGFRNNCFLKEVVIPASVQRIEAGAFKGCHNLQTVFFEAPGNITFIGEQAFQTQDIASADHKTRCPNKTLPTKPSLYFVGDINSASLPFQYAMTPANRINMDGQERAYIVFCSGWPTNLQVQYDHETGKNTLISYPTFKQVSQYNLSSFPYMEPEYVTAASQALSKYTSHDTMTDGERKIVEAITNIELPYGIEAIKDGLIRANEGAENSLVQRSKTFTAHGLQEIHDCEFADCNTFTGIYLMDTVTKIGDGAFENCAELTDVTISNTVVDMGKLPFYGCKKLNYVNFMNSPYFNCPSTQSGMIFQLDENGKAKKLVEVLQGRSNSNITASELAGISQIAEGAFKGTDVGVVDMTQSSISTIPSQAFADTPKLNYVYFPHKWTRVDADAFRNSGVVYLEIYGEFGNIDANAFSGTTNNSGAMTIYCEEDSATQDYAILNHINYVNIASVKYYTVEFFDYDNTPIGDPQLVQSGKDAVAPEEPTRVGYIFDHWSWSYKGVTEDLKIKAEYRPDDLYGKVEVNFYDNDGTHLGGPYYVAVGGYYHNAPNPPAKPNQRFVGWTEDLENITTDINPHAIYEFDDGKHTVRFLDEDEKTVLYSVPVEDGKDCILPIPPTKAGKTFVKWTPSPVKVTQDMDVIAVFQDGNGNTNNPSGGGTPSNNTVSKLYTLTVKNGLGTGSFVAGANVVIKAQEAGSNQEFVNWTVDPSDVVITDKNVSAAIITMPAGDVTVTANFRTKSGGNNNNNNNGNNNGGSINNNNTHSSGTTVVIDKNGLSNTGVVSAVVNGSSDNFTIKLKEDANASELAMRALMAEYGNDLSGIKYFPVDISLYDSTGKNMITDTTGLSISITIPIPDSMIDYAGNNKVASVTGGTLEKLNAKFTTISGVPCITFKAEHFSPYVIYVNTKNLTAGTVADTTPKTGDGIHPKWFLSIGLAFASIFLFFAKDNKKKKAPVRAGAR